MANTRTSTKRARQAAQRQVRNQIVRSSTRSVLRGAVDALKSQDAAKAKEAYQAAVRGIMKAASKKAIPQRRAARKISRLTRMFQKGLPGALPASQKKAAPAAK